MRAKIIHKSENYGVKLQKYYFCNGTLEIDEKFLGPQHPYFATTLNNLAELYNDIGKYEKALQLYQRLKNNFQN